MFPPVFQKPLLPSLIVSPFHDAARLVLTAMTLSADSRCYRRGYTFKRIFPLAYEKLTPHRMQVSEYVSELLGNGFESCR